MSFSGVNVQAAVEVAKGAADILPTEGRHQVLDHLLAAATKEELKKLSPEARAKLLLALAEPEVAPSSTQSPIASPIATVNLPNPNHQHHTKMKTETKGGVYYPLCAERFEISQEIPILTVIIKDMVAAYEKMLAAQSSLSGASASTELPQSNPSEDQRSESLENLASSLRDALDQILRKHLRYDRNIAVAKKTKVGIVYDDLIARFKGVDCFQDYFTELLRPYISNPDMLREISYQKLIKRATDCGYRVGRIESYYVDPETRKLPGHPVVTRYIRDLTTRELQLIKIGSELGSLAASTPAIHLDDSVRKIEKMALTCARLLSEVVPIPDEPLDYHNFFFQLVADIMRAVCRVSFSNEESPDCRWLLNSEDPIPKNNYDESSADKIAKIFEKWPFTTDRLHIEERHSQLVKDRLAKKPGNSSDPDHEPNTEC